MWGQPKHRGDKLDRANYGFKQAHQHFRNAVMLLSKIGFRADEVATMSFYEVQAWVDSYLESQGVKSETPTYQVVRKRDLAKYRELSSN